MRIGVDLGGTKVEAIGLDTHGNELRRLRVATPKGDYDGTIAAIVGLVHEIERATGRVGSVGVGIPGTVQSPAPDSNGVIPDVPGLVKNANSTWLNGRPLEHDLSVALGREVRCANDANCFAISEATDGAAKGYETVFGVIMGTGCGGGVVFGGRVGAGPNGLRGEWGHTPLPWQTPDEYPGPPCYCGRTGCLEKWISGTGLEDDYERVNGRRLKGHEIVTAAEQGEVHAVAALDRLEDRVGRALAMVVNILDPDVFVLGGGLSGIDRLYTGGVARVISRYTFGGNTYTPILRNLHGDSSGVRGAAWLWPQQH